jgi:hypothetical protein
MTIVTNWHSHDTISRAISACRALLIEGAGHWVQQAGQSLAVAIREAGRRTREPVSSSPVHYQSDIMARLSQEPSFDGSLAEVGQCARQHQLEE